MVNCAKCGEVKPEGKNFCGTCGEKVVVAQKPSAGMDYEEYRMEKSKYIGSTIFHTGAVMLVMGLALSYFLTFGIDLSYGQESEVVEVPYVSMLSKITVITGAIMMFIGALWSLMLDGTLTRSIPRNFGKRIRNR